MSHFNLAVLHSDPDGASIDEMLAPFDETTDNPDYLTFEEDEDGLLDEKTGKRGYYLNANAKWDWFVPGGRWRGLIKLKPGATGRYGEPSNNPACPDDRTHCDTARIKDIDFTPSKEAYQRALAVWDHVVEGQPWTDTEHEAPFTVYKPEYYRNLYGDRETYARQMSEFSTYAYLTEDSGWREPGTMGWFGMSDETLESKAAYIADFKHDIIGADPELYLTIIDCHI